MHCADVTRCVMSTQRDRPLRSVMDGIASDRKSLIIIKGMFQVQCKLSFIGGMCCIMCITTTSFSLLKIKVNGDSVCRV